MRRIFRRSKINLNLGFGKPILRARTLARIFIRPTRGGGFAPDPLGIGRNIKTILNRRNPQSRARPFEIASCGGFVLTNRVPLFGEPYREGKEIVYYDDVKDAAAKIAYYGSHDAEREAIRAAGHERTLRDHSFEKRFKDIFEIIFSANGKSQKGMSKII